MINADSERMATLWDKICLIGVVFIPATFLHFTFTFLKSNQNARVIIKFCYVLSIIFLSLNFTPYFIKETGPIYKLRFFTVPGPGYLTFLVYYSAAVVCGICLLYRGLNKARGLYRQQLLYLFWGTLIGYSGGSLNYNLVLKYPPYELVPWGNYLIGIYGILIAYAIVKYRLMDIKLAITRMGIFLCVYALVLGIPFGVGIKYLGTGLWLMPVSLMAVCATVGPFIYLYIQKKAEEQLLVEQRQYQATLRQASLGMGRIKDLKRLLNLIVYVVARVVRVEHASVYLLDRDSGKYMLKAFKGHKIDSPNTTVFSFDDPLVHYLQKVKEPVLYEELEQKVHDGRDNNLREAVGTMKTLHAELAVPCIIDERMQAVVILGRKRSEKTYSHDDLVVFSILASQSAMAIENCHFIEAEKEALKVEGARARRESLDMLVSTMAHEIDNPLASVVGNADMMREFVINAKSRVPEDVFLEITRSAQVVINEALRVSKIVKAVEDYSKGGEGMLKPTSIYEVLESYHTLMILIRKNIPGVDYTEDIASGLPAILADKILVEEILINYAENAFHAVRGNIGEKIVCLRIYNDSDQMLAIEMRDNGYGIPAKIHKQIFEVPTTTKGSSEGTGLGLYRVRQICGILKAQYGARSDGPDKGSVFFVKIPFAKEVQHG